MPTSDHLHHVLDTDIPIFYPIDGIFDPLNLSEILYSLEGKNEIPSKYMYFGKGLENWSDRSIKSKEELVNFRQNNFGKQYDLMNETLNLVLGAASEKNMLNVVDVGPGTGYPVFPILSYLKEKKKLSKYITVDIVEEMCDLAIKNLTDIDILSKIKTQKYIHDFEYGHFANLMLKERKEGCVNLFVFMGSTLSNLVDRHRALANIRDSMTAGDLLWVGIPLHSNLKELMSFYEKTEINSKKYLDRCKLFTSFLESFGMNEWMNYGRIGVKEFEDTGLLKYNFIVEKSFILEFPKSGKSTGPIQLKYQEGDKITLCRLKNYEDQDLVAEFREAGFKLKMLNVSDDYRYALVLVSV